MYSKQELIDKLIPIFREYPIQRAFFFGSYARGDYNPDSDVDIMLEFTGKRYGLLFSRLNIILQEELGIAVDLVSRQGLSGLDKEFQSTLLSNVNKLTLVPKKNWVYIIPDLAVVSPGM